MCVSVPPSCYEYLAFSGGRRFVLIATGLAAVMLGIVFGWLWPTIQMGIDSLGHWLIEAGALGKFVYGALNRLLIVTGLHHVLNSFVWFVFGSFEGATGDLNRFFAGDPSAGGFMAGFFPVLMFGLPAAALGGTGYLQRIGACTTRLRVELKDPARLDAERLETLGCRGSMTIGDDVRHMVVESRAGQIAASLSGGG
ncbi:PTS transporter subunit EIIC [Halomonas sp. 18H]|uniref:PTS transporter subunit EIIC n=1 Tax=Halomonas almeriensis TaxID=308163 RepID=UPI0022314AF8|nr:MULTISPECIES: PTS transporter subunit EIIC [Halomonas]MCW4149170.1 PTS transporter subunit EIIC [Halomonas sp. 18H]MDN3552280.1 PTS transporter subunit EIIC [Halomonas almeriensis]